jgi:hypothetical protein
MKTSLFRSRRNPLPRAVAGAIAMLACVLMLAACSQNGPTPYASAYEDALERYPGTAPVAAERVQAFVDFFSHGGNSHGSSGGEAETDPAELYADHFYFSDTLLTTDDPARALAHLRRMRANTDTIEVRLLNRLDDGADVYLVWHMQATFAPVRQRVTSTTVGVTHLRFDAAGRIVLHQDFWDASEGLYQHVPMLGRVIHRIRRSF